MMNKACIACPASLACIARMVPHYYQCGNCDVFYVRPVFSTSFRHEGDSIALSTRECKLPFVSPNNMYMHRDTYCDACGKSYEFAGQTWPMNRPKEPEKKPGFWSRLASRIFWSRLTSKIRNRRE